MPCVENWNHEPLKIISNLFENRKNDESWKNEVEKYFENRLQNNDNISVIPSLNDIELSKIKPNSFVRFRCMIQDTFEPEYFLEKYEVLNKNDSSHTIHSSRYKDTVKCPNNCEIVMESNKNVTGCRQVLYCVSVPGETSWVKEQYKQASKIQHQNNNQNSGGVKRALPDDDEEMDETVCENGDDSPNKRHQSSNHTDNSKKLTPLKRNHPLPDENGPVCLVKVYSETLEVKVNEVYEFYGVLSVDPELASAYDQASGDNSAVDSFHLEEQRAHNPPASFVPRLHCITMKLLHHNNPLLSHDKLDFSEFQTVATSLRIELVNFLKQATFGDALTAEYILFHMLAKVYTRTGLMPVGKWSLNISKIPSNSRYPYLLANFIKQLVSKCFLLPMSLDNMNKLAFIPTKNYTTNRLDSGILQLSEGTSLIVDETSLQPGQLDVNGVKNVQALSTLMNFQKVDYNFQFHPVTFEHNINVLVLSEGKSMLPCDCQIPLKPEFPVPNNLDEYFSGFQLPMDLVNKFRLFITLARLGDYDLEKDMMKVIENDFVAARRCLGEDKMTADDLHVHLVIARLLSTSSGENKLTSNMWKQVQRLEEQRRERL